MIFVNKKVKNNLARNLIFMNKNLHFLILIITLVGLIIPLDNIFAVGDNLFNVDANTVALWRFNESILNPVIDEVGVNNGTAIGTTIVNGIFNKARHFNGANEYIVVPDNPNAKK